MDALPENFRGLSYAPSAESAVYFLLGLLWNDIPYQIAFDGFEMNPAHHGYEHTKHLDARARMLRNGEWQQITVEFKLNSSGWPRDIRNKEHLTSVDLLICWEHDDAAVEEYAETILALKDIYSQLPLFRQRELIWDDSQTGKSLPGASPVAELLERFGESAANTVRALIEEWAGFGLVEGGVAEIKFVKGQHTLIRACPYDTKHLILTQHIPRRVFKDLLARFPTQPLKTEQVKIMLEDVTCADAREIAEAVKRSFHRD